MQKTTSFDISNEISNNMRSCGKRLLFIFAILQLAKCIYSQEQFSNAGASAEPSVIVLEQVEGLDNPTSEKSINSETTLNAELNPTLETSIDPVNTVRNEIDPTIISVTTESDVGQDITEFVATEEPSPQLIEKLKCLCDCDTGMPNSQCTNETLDKPLQSENKDEYEESKSEDTGKNETTDRAGLTDEPITEENKVSIDTTETNTVSETKPQTDSPINPQKEFKAEPPTNSFTEPSTDSPTESQSETTTTITETPELGTTASEIFFKPCTSIGDFANDGDCQLYYTCTLQIAGTATVYERIEKSCPTGNAFNSELGRCTRDISNCNDGSMPCEQEGSFSDPQSNSSYYRCVTHLNGAIGFHKYHIQCPIGKVFVLQLGKCFIDINNLNYLSISYGKKGMGQSNEDDENIIKAELKQLKELEKTRLKEEKLREKMNQKLQKELSKKAAKDAKELASKEAEQFVCTQEGNFASALSVDRYFACIIKKDKFKVMAMKCPMGNVFDVQRAACLPNNIDTDDDDDDDEDDEDDD